MTQQENERHGNRPGGIKAEIIKFPVSGFRDFTSIAARDP
jgi:hypothetical protein